RIQLFDSRVIPGLDVAEENLGESWPIEDEIAGLHALKIDDRYDAAHHHRELSKAGFIELLARQRRVAGSEGNGLSFDLFNSATGTDRLVVQSITGDLFVLIRPLGIDRIRESGAGTRNVGGFGRDKRCHGDSA